VAALIGAGPLGTKTGAFNACEVRAFGGLVLATRAGESDREPGALIATGAAEAIVGVNAGAAAVKVGDEVTKFGAG
jgi:co-chaperonin GroES (HSP10)